MSCGFSREMLALHVEGDLSDEAAAATVRHLASCEACGRFLEELRDSQALMKGVRREMVSRADCTAMRREVMTIISERRGLLGWRVRIERAIALGLRPSYGLAALLMLGVVSASMFAQIRTVADRAVSPAVIEGSDTVLRPDAYRDWVLVSAGGASDAPGLGSASDDRVYINPASYREYAKTGRFPDGTMLVWEAGSPERSSGGAHATSATLLISLKDSTKFEGGWGFFDFSGTSEGRPAKARPLPDARGCGSCHRQNAKNDHVFTQFYPGLRSRPA